MLLKARLYRFSAFAFALIGVVIFMMLYFRHIDGHLVEALTSPSLIGIILIPFLPAVVLSWLSARTENKLFKLMHGDDKGGK